MKSICEDKRILSYYVNNSIVFFFFTYSFDEVVTENDIASEFNSTDSNQDFVNVVAEQTDENR